MTDAEEADVVVLGAGLAALTLCRQLALEVPGLRVVAADPAPGPSPKVGESTVEIGAHYLNVRLQLGEMLARTQLPKNGLRFFFDDESHTTPLTEASEDGPITFSYWQSFQLERDSFERDLVRLDRQAGAEIHFGARDLAAEPGGSGRPHAVHFTVGGQPRRLRCRWLIDATGNASWLGRRLDNIAPEERLDHGACWAWYRGFAPPDEFLAVRGDHRPIYGRRTLSTNHLMNEGYWLWWIPLASGLMSVGYVYDKNVVETIPTRLDDLDTFVRGHRMSADLMTSAEPVGFGCLRRMAHRPGRFLHDDRVAHTGMAAGFLDPFYSSGTDLIALANECIVRLIASERAGEDWRALVEPYERMLHACYEGNLLFTSHQYQLFASHELFVPKYRRDLHVYWNSYAWPYFSQQLFDPGFLDLYLPVLDETRRYGRFFNRLFGHVCSRLRATGRLRRANRGAYAFNQLGYRTFPYIRFERQMGSPVDPARTIALREEIDAGTFLALFEILEGGDRLPLRRLLFERLRGEPMARLVETAERHGFAEEFWTQARRVLGPERLGVDLEHLDDPVLLDLSGIGRMKERVQPPLLWTFDHTPWVNGGLDFRTVYDLIPGFAG